MATVKTYDYESVLARLKERVLQKLGEAQSLILFSANSAILEACAEELADTSMYDEFLTREAVWETAEGMSSIMKQVTFYAYVPHRKTGSQGLIRYSTSPTFNGNYGKNITLPRFTQFSGGGLTFLTKVPNFFPGEAPYLDLEVIQGTKTVKTIEITSSAFPLPNETKYATVVIDDPVIENSLYEVRVNGELWKEIAQIRLSTSGKDPVYTVRSLPNFAGVELSFGNDLFGKKLQYGDFVEFTYLKTEGSKGNVLSSGIIVTIDSKITDETSETVKGYCTNNEALIGGSDYESLDEIKVNAPKAFQTGNRAISSRDYVSIIEGLNITDKAMVWGEKEINEDRGNKPGTYVAASENLIYITGFTIDPNTLLGISISAATQTIIRNALNDKKGTTDILQFIDTKIVYISFRSNVWISDSKWTPEQVKGSVTNILKDAYSIYKSVYKKSFYFSDYYKTIDAADGVDHHETSISFSQMYKFASAYEFNANLNINAIQQNSLRIMLRNEAAGMNDWNEMARDDGSGNIVGSPIDPDDPSSDPYVIPGATISYINGEIGNIIVTFGLDAPFATYEIRIDFNLRESEKGNLVLPLRQQVFAYYKNEVITHVMGV